MRITVFKVNIACEYLLELFSFIQKTLHSCNAMSLMHFIYKRHCSHCTLIHITSMENLVFHFDFKYKLY